MQIGDTYLYKQITVVESTGECPHPDYVCGVFNGDQPLPFVWLGKNDELKQECKTPRVIDIVEAPDWMTTEEMRKWVLSRPSLLDDYFDDEWILHHDLLELKHPNPVWDGSANQQNSTD